jgi:hypothetical protein
MSMRTKRGMKPTDIILPITPMLDMSFQLLFFFICIYKPPVSQEAQFKLNLSPPPITQGPGAQGSGTGGSGSPIKDPPDLPIAYNITLDVYTHINPNERGVGDLLVEKIQIGGMVPSAKEVLKERGWIADSKPEIVEIAAPTVEGQAAVVTAETEKDILDKIPDVLRAAKDAIPPESATPTATIKVPRELRMYKVVRLMDYCNRYGFALDLKVVQR